jgi:flagellin-specific chaperone FliS
MDIAFNDRKEMLTEMGFKTLADVPHELITLLYNAYKTKMNPDSHVNILLAFINEIFVINKLPQITKLNAFMNINKDKTTFVNVSKDLSERISRVFNIDIHNDTANIKNGLSYIKKMLKKIPSYDIIVARKVANVGTVDKPVKKIIQIYTIK